MENDGAPKSSSLPRGSDVAQNIVGLMPDARLVMLADSGHLPWLDFPTEIGDQSRQFLDVHD